MCCTEPRHLCHSGTRQRSRFDHLPIWQLEKWGRARQSLTQRGPPRYKPTIKSMGTCLRNSTSTWLSTIPRRLIAGRAISSRSSAMHYGAERILDRWHGRNPETSFARFPDLDFVRERLRPSESACSIPGDNHRPSLDRGGRRNKILRLLRPTSAGQSSVLCGAHPRICSTACQGDVLLHALYSTLSRPWVSQLCIHNHPDQFNN